MTVRELLEALYQVPFDAEIPEAFVSDGLKKWAEENSVQVVASDIQMPSEERL